MRQVPRTGAAEHAAASEGCRMTSKDVERLCIRLWLGVAIAVGALLDLFIYVLLEQKNTGDQIQVIAGVAVGLVLATAFWFVRFL